MGSLSIDVNLPDKEIFSEIQQCVGKAEYKVKTIVPNQTIIAEGNRDFSWTIVIILIILIWPAALVYYYTRQRSSVTATITKDNEGKCNVTITSNGNSGDNIIELIESVLQDDNEESDVD